MVRGAAVALGLSLERESRQSSVSDEPQLYHYYSAHLQVDALAQTIMPDKKPLVLTITLLDQLYSSCLLSTMLSTMYTVPYHW